jgi:transcriptional regulator with XRE-family HTH domain/tetratricopeptide (TPR) repeat protein
MTRESGPPWPEVVAILRLIRRWTPDQLAAAAGLKPRSVQALERGDRPLDRPAVAHLAATMGFPPRLLDRTAAFVDRARAVLAPDASTAQTPDIARQARIASLAATAGQWFEDLTRTGLSGALVPAAGPLSEPVLPLNPATAIPLPPHLASPAAATDSPPPFDPAAPAPPLSDTAALAQLLGEALAVLRVICRQSQTELGAASGVPRDSISDYERGRFAPRSETLQRLVDAMGFTAATFDRARTFVEEVRDARHDSDLPAGDRALIAEIEDFAGDEGRAMEDFTRRRLVRIGLVARVLASRRQAPALWARLAPLPEGDQQRLVAGDPTLWTSGFCELLCQQSIDAAGDSAARAVHLAQLAVRVARRVEEDSPWPLRLEGYAWAHLANALRVASDLPAAERTFVHAMGLWEAGAASDPGLLNEARVLHLLASLRRAQRSLPETLALIDRALAVDRWHETPRLLISKAKALEQAGDYHEAVKLLRQVASQSGRNEEPELVFWVRWNLAVNLCQLGQYAEAELLLPDIRSLAATVGGHLDRVRVRWIQGKIAAGQGRPEEALSILAEVRREFLARSLVYDAALVTVELSEIYASLGQTSRVKLLAHESASVFAAQGVHREAQAALEHFRAAAEAERLSLELVRRVVAYLYRARQDPHLRFEAPA